MDLSSDVFFDFKAKGFDNLVGESLVDLLLVVVDCHIG